ncbi:MAG: altronate dehydratase [Colwellia sp.]
MGIASQVDLVPMDMSELVVGTICGGSDGTSGIGASPAVGHCFDKLIEQDAICIFEETGELIGCEKIMAERAITPELGVEIMASVEKQNNIILKWAMAVLPQVMLKVVYLPKKKNQWAPMQNRPVHKFMA